MSDNYIKNVVEAALLAAGRPLQLTELAQLFEEHARPEPAVFRAALEALDADYSGRGIEVKETATGFRIQVRKEMANEVSRLWPERPPKYSRALLETLALIAYRQPITRAEIEAVRGVAVNPNIIKTVIERNWVRVVGTRDVPGRPELLGTTKDFLDYFGLRALDELPPLAELKAMGEINLQLDLAKPAEAGADAASAGSDEGSSGSDGGAGGATGSDEGSGASGAGGASNAGQGGGSGGTSGTGSLAAAGAIAGGAVAAGLAAASDDGSSVEAVAGDHSSVEGAASDGAPGVELAAADAASAASEGPAEIAAVQHDELVAYEHDPHSATLTHVEIESDPGDVTVEVEALTFVEQQLEAEERARSNDASIETGELERAELGMPATPAPVIEAEFDVEDLSSAQADDDDAADDAADDDDELSAGPQSSTELVAAPRDRDD